MNMSHSERNSAFELMRLVAQWFIVAYHIFLFYFFLNNDDPNVIFKAIWIPLHVGVPLFVLVSGFFRIKLSIRGLLRIVANLFVYGLVFSLVYLCMTDGQISWKTFCFVSNTGSWFVRTYLILYLLSPLLNRFLSETTPRVRLMLLCILGYCTLWIGWMNFDKNMDEGYDVLNFIFLYMLGCTLAEYKDQLNKIPTWGVLSAWIVLNVLYVYGYCHLGFYNKYLFTFAFPYNSPGIVINSVSLFILFMRMSFHSKTINYMASSSLAIYLIHSGSLMFKTVVKDGSEWIRDIAKTGGGQIALVFVFALVIVLVCIGIDKCLTPLWNLVNKGADKLSQTRLGKIVEEYSYR